MSSGVWLILQTSNISDWEVFFLRDFSHSHIWSGSDGNSTADLGGIWGVLFIKPQANLPFISGNSRNFPKFSEYRDLGCKYVHGNWEKCVSSPRPNDTKRKEETVTVCLRHILLHMLHFWPYVWLPWSKSCPDAYQRNDSQNWCRFLSEAGEKSCFCVCVLQAEWTELQVYFNQPAH